MAQAPRPGGFGDDYSGEERVTVEGVTFRLGDTVLLRPGAGGTAEDGMLAGRSATIERILIDYDDAVHLAVTVDGDPGQELMREMGRYLFFKPHEVEATAA
jgi:hypothetical protein